MKKIILAVAVAAVAIMGIAGSALAGGGTGITATPAATKEWAGHKAKFVRSASGVINETNRVNISGGPQNQWTNADVYLQFRPLTGPNGTGSPTPNPACDPNGLVTAPFEFRNDPVVDTQIAGTPAAGYFIGKNPYNVCVYLVNPQVASGTIDSASFDGSTATLPTNLGGHYRIDVSGTYINRDLNVADAEYTTRDNWATAQQGYDVDPFDLGESFGDVQVDGNFVNWGALTSSHAYSLDTTLSGSVNLSVFDGDSTTNTKEAAWYGDNSGSLNYKITYLGL